MLERRVGILWRGRANYHGENLRGLTGNRSLTAGKPCRMFYENYFIFLVRNACFLAVASTDNA